MKPLFLPCIIFILLTLLTRLFLHFSSLSLPPNGETITLTTRIASEPEVEAKAQRFRILTDTGESIWVSVGKFPEYTYGQLIHIKGKLRVSTRDGKPAFLTLRYPSIMPSEDDNNMLLSVIYSFRQRTITVFESSLSPIHSALLLGIVFGIKRDIPDVFYSQLQTAGVLHVIAASGMNVSMVAAASFFLLQGFVSRKKALILSLMGIILYAILAGLEPSIVRASIMAGITFIASLLGRQKVSVYTLFLTGTIMLIARPGLVIDVGFQLSFMATLGILLLKPIFAYFEKGKVGSLIGSDVSTTITAQIATLPILLSSFGSVNLLSVLINALILWTIPIVMVIGSIAAIIGIIFPVLSQMILLFAIPFLWFFETVIRFSSRFPVFLQIDSFPAILVIGYYLVVAAVVLSARKKQLQLLK